MATLSSFNGNCEDFCMNRIDMVALISLNWFLRIARNEMTLDRNIYKGF